MLCKKYAFSSNHGNFDIAGKLQAASELLQGGFVFAKRIHPI